MIYLLLFVTGLGLGILINCLADALPPDELGEARAVSQPRCRYCGAPHRPVYWLAVVHFLWRSGQCEHCGAPRRRRAAVVEIITALSLAGLWYWAGGGAPGQRQFWPAAVIVCFFILFCIIDIEHRLILWKVVVAAAVMIGLINTLSRGWPMTLGGGVAGYGLVLGLFLVGQLFSVVLAWVRGQPLDEVAFGGGDVNLGGVIGLAVGWPHIMLALMVGIFASGLFSFVYMLWQGLRRRYTPYTPIPYGPFLIFGALAIYLYGPELLAWYVAGR